MESSPQRNKDMKENWYLDKRVPLTLIFTLLLQTVGLFVWGAKLDGRVGVAEQSITQHAVSIETLKASQNQISIGLARIEERQIVTAEGVKDIKERLDR